MEKAVVRDPDEGRREDGDERLVVVAVVQQPQVPEEVDDLLLVVVVPAGRAERGQAERTKLLLVDPRIRARREEEHDLARRRLARVDELLHALGDMLGLGRTPVDARVLVARLVGDEQLDRGAERGILEATGSRERPERVAEVRREEVVDHLEHLGPRAVVLGQRQHAARGFAPLAEDLDIRMPEPVDRLELVADEEQVFRGEQVDELALQPVRVLELVDEDGAEAPALALADRRLVAQEVARRQLEVLEVERRLGRLRGGVRVGEAPEQLLEQRTIARGKLVERRLLDGRARLLVPREQLARPAPRRDVGQVEQPLGRGRSLEQLERPRDACASLVRLVYAGRLVERHARRLAELLDSSLEPRPLGHLEHELAPGRAERLVDARQHSAQAPRPVRGQEADALGIVRRAELLECEVERLAREHAGLVLVEHAEVRVDRCLERMRLQEAVAEAVNRGDPGAVELTGEVVPVELRETAADPAAQLTCGPFRVRDREHRVDRKPAFAHRPYEALDEHRRLSGACAGGDEDEPARVDRRELLGARRARFVDHRHVRATRHIAHRSHQVGHGNPPFGSC